MKKLKVTLLIFILPILLWAQDNQIESSAVKMIVCPKPDSIMLRWAPNNVKTWKLGNKYGYVVKRYTLLRNGKYLQDKEMVQLSPQPLSPQPVEKWEPYMEDNYTAIAAQCIFGRSMQDINTGGSLSLVMRKHKEEKQAYGMALFSADASLQAASLSGLYYCDKTAKPNEKYLYRVMIPVPDSIATVDTAFFFTGCSEYIPLPQPLGLDAVWEDEKVTLGWNKSYLKRTYNNYVLEKSLDGEVFTQITDEALISLSQGEEQENGMMFSSDSLEDNTTTYYYRVRGINAFGEKGPPSAIVSGKGFPRIKLAPELIDKQAINNEAVHLAWFYPEDMTPYIDGFKVYRSMIPKGEKELVHTAAPSDRAYLDREASVSNYYTVSVFQKEQELKSLIPAYVPLIDSIPPQPPIDIAGMMDSVGRVSLSWKANTENDIYGYRVYRANYETHEFSLITPAPITTTTFSDSVVVRTLTPKVFYKVTALDQRQNESDKSLPAAIERPDVIPPVSPVLRWVREGEELLKLAWYKSQSRDVAAYQLYRCQGKGQSFNLRLSFDALDSITYYEDEKVLTGEYYSYYLVAEDRSGLKSEPSRTLGAIAKGKVLPEVELNRILTMGGLTLRWNINSLNDVERVVIYRGVDENPIRLYTNTTEEQFVEDNLVAGKTYRYRVRVVYVDGTSSNLSEEVRVKM